MSNRKARRTFAVLARSLAEEDAGESVTKNRYLEYEAVLERVAERLGMTVGEMDLYLWSKKTSSVMK